MPKDKASQLIYTMEDELKRYKEAYKEKSDTSSSRLFKLYILALVLIITNISRWYVHTSKPAPTCEMPDMIIMRVRVIPTGWVAE